MDTSSQTNYYAGVPDALIKELDRFRTYHPPRFLESQSRRWSYLTAGEPSAPVLLLLHGGGGDAETMFRYIEGFSGDFYVIAPDLPPQVSHMDDALPGLLHILQTEQVDKAQVVGMSFGALLAQMFVRRFPSRVQNLVLTHTLLPSEHLLEATKMQRNLMRISPASLLMWRLRRAHQKAIAQSRTPADSHERAFWQAYFDELYATRFSKQDVLSRVSLTIDYHSSESFTVRDLRGWSGQLLIIESSEDDVITEGDRGALKGMYPGAYIQTLPGHDHLAPLLASRELLASIRKFLLQKGDLT
jgi:pimeloyl-ACP methyl ester carboxylesterase